MLAATRCALPSIAHADDGSGSATGSTPWGDLTPAPVAAMHDTDKCGYPWSTMALARAAR